MSYRLCAVAVLDVVVAVHGARLGRPVPKVGRLGMVHAVSCLERGTESQFFFKSIFNLSFYLASHFNIFDASFVSAGWLHQPLALGVDFLWLRFCLCMTSVSDWLVFGVAASLEFYRVRCLGNTWSTLGTGKHPPGGIQPERHDSVDVSGLSPKEVTRDPRDWRTSACGRQPRRY